MSEFTIKKNDKSRIKDVLSLCEKFHAESGESGPFDRVRVLSFLCGICERDNGLMLVAVDGVGNTVGFLVGHSFQNYLTGELMSEETAIYVDKPYRKHGLGDVLLDEFEEWSISSRGVRRIRVTAQSSLRVGGVTAWFKSRGYKEVEVSLTKEVSV